MESFLKLILNRDISHLIEKAPESGGDSLNSSFIKFLQKIIFKHDVMVEFEEILKSACSSEPFTVKNDLVKKIIVSLNSTLLSDVDNKSKIEVFFCVFQTFILSCKRNEKLPALQFFAVLAHLLGMDVLSSKDVADTYCVVNAENFKHAFNVEISSPLQVSYSILKELLVCCSNDLIIVNSSETLVYHKWLQKLIRKLANAQPLQSIFMEIFSTCFDIDLKLAEKNVEHIIRGFLSQSHPVNEDIAQSYASFLECGLKTSAKFQRTAKFIKNYLLAIRTTSTILYEEVILPLNFVNEFSKIVALAPTQQSLLLFENLVLNLTECCTAASENTSEFQSLPIVCTLLVAFLKEVKIFAPSISANSLQMLIDKLNSLIKILQTLGNDVLSNKECMMKSENIIRSHLQVCLYCGEVQALIDCYKDSVVKPSELESCTNEKNWLCCITIKQWNSLVKLVVKSKLESCYLVCLQLALHKLRTIKLHETPIVDRSTLKVILSAFESEPHKFDIFEQVTPENFTIITSFLTPDQAKTVAERIFHHILNAENMEWKSWLCDSHVQENLIFIMNLLSELFKKTSSLLSGNKFYSKFSWMSDEYFSGDNEINKENLKHLPAKINKLLKIWVKICKSVDENVECVKEMVRIFKVFKLLPINYLKEDYRQLGLSFAVAVGVILSHDESAICLPLESMCCFVASEADASTCFDVGVCMKWLCEVAFEGKEASDLKMKVIERLVRSCPDTRFGLSQMGGMIEVAETLRPESPLKLLESRVVLYNELGKCWQRAKKRQADNDLIGTFRTKLARVIGDEAKELETSEINLENCKLLFQIFVIELQKGIKMNQEEEVSVLMEQKFPSYFDFAVKSLNKAYDESSVSFLTFILRSMPQIKKFLPGNTLLRIWESVLRYGKGNWRLFCSDSDDDEFKVILSNLLEMSEKFLTSGPDQHTSNYFEIWRAFFEFSSGSKRQACQLLLQDLFRFTHICDLLLSELSMKKRICTIKFYSFCLSSEKVILTSHMLDTIIHVMVEFLDQSSSIEDFHNLFLAEMDAAVAILLKQFLWTRNKIHLSFVLFKRMLVTLTKRCDVARQVSQDDIIKLSACALAMERWVKLMVDKKKDFARIVAYFIIAVISVIASNTILPAIKFHLINCINAFLSISDSHTVSYLMRVLKPGYQQVFNSIYNQFKKYHKYTGKI